METHREAEIAAWLVQAGLSGLSEPDLLKGFCKRLRGAGLPVCRALVLIDTLHPVHEGRVFRWRSDQAAESQVVEYGRTNEGGDGAERWQQSPFFRMLELGHGVLRRRLHADEHAFPVFDELRDEGQTDYLALIQRFSETGTIGEMDCVYSSWTSDAPSGFEDGVVEGLKHLVPTLALAMKAASLARIAETLAETYLGRDAGQRVLAGKIQRGVAERIEAVLWFSDLRGFTTISDTARPEEIIPFLNDYADAIISAVQEAGGDVLKLIGDGTLAIFTAEEPETACRKALQAERLARARVVALNTRRDTAGLPVATPYLGLHVGEVFFGNIGSKERLDFTVVGPAVNETSRIAAMCRSVERDVLVSSAFRDAATEADRAGLVSVGRYALRGVGRPQELFTLEPDEPAG